MKWNFPDHQLPSEPFEEDFGTPASMLIKVLVLEAYKPVQYVYKFIRFVYLYNMFIKVSVLVQLCDIFKMVPS